MARKNRFMHDDEENEIEAGEALTSVPVAEVPKEEEKPEGIPPEPMNEPEPKPEPVANILADLIPQKPKPKPETYGFYLDSDVHDELVRLAKANKTNKSKFLNALLRRVLFNE